MKTAQEFLEERHSDPTIPLDCRLDMIEFAKMHCKSQTEAILNNVDIDYVYLEYSGEEPDAVINEDSIKNAYPLTNIK